MIRWPDIQNLARLIALSCILGTAAFTAASADQLAKHSDQFGSHERQRTLVIGRVSQHPEKHMAALTQMARYLASKLDHLGISEGAAVVASDNREMIKLLQDGHVDVVSETALSALLFEDEADAEILLREWKNGVAGYHTVFFARADSKIRALSDLNGGKIAFEDPGSTSGYILPLAALNHVGLHVVQLESPSSPAPADGVGYSFAHGELNTAIWVQRGLMCAGVMSNRDWIDRVRAPEVIKNELVAFHRGPSFIRSLLVVRQGILADVKVELKNILLNIHEDSNAAAVLSKYNKVTQYDEISGDAAQQLVEARLVYKFVRSAINWMKPAG